MNVFCQQYGYHATDGEEDPEQGINECCLVFVQAIIWFESVGVNELAAHSLAANDVDVIEEYQAQRLYAEQSVALRAWRRVERFYQFCFWRRKPWWCLS